ncbi:MAG: S8 family serine peptidase [Planctomycetes bacterium]|nr:S8 family serine peptidase [Planctomycetota bacterium]
MKKINDSVMFSFFLSFVFIASVEVNGQDTRVIVKGSGGAGQISNAVNHAGGTVNKVLGTNTVVATIDAKSIQSLTREINISEVVIDPVARKSVPKQNKSRVSASPLQVQPAQSFPWGVNRIDAEYAWFAWFYTPWLTGTGVKIGVIDTGIDANHPDFKKNGVSNVILGPSYVGTPTAQDDEGHGTHVAGTAAARGDNNGDGILSIGGPDIGTVGVAPDATLVAVKVLDFNGSGWLSDALDAMVWASNPALGNCKVLNLSLTSVTSNPSTISLVNSYVNTATNNGAVVVCAAGNSNSGTPEWPAGATNAVSVAAIDSANNRAWFSNYGSTVDIAAPGVSIYSTYLGSTYATLNGTSMASPHVAGTCALIYYIMQLVYQSSGAAIYNPTPANIKNRLYITADPLTSPLPIGGRLDAEEAATGGQIGNN